MVRGVWEQVDHLRRSAAPCTLIAGLATNATWVSDANCRESQTRIRNYRYNWTVSITEPVAGNYVPVNCLLRCVAGGAAYRALWYCTRSHPVPRVVQHVGPLDCHSRRRR